jgi:Tol biopolymer transport system component
VVPRGARRRTAAATLATLGAAGLAACLPWAAGNGGTGPGGGGTPLVFGSDGNIAVLALDGSRRQALTKVAGGALARDPAWSPDGRQIAYSYTPPLPTSRGPGGLLPLPVTDIYVMNADGTGAQVLVEHGAPGIGFETPVWAPDGKSFFVTYTELVMERNIVSDQILELARVAAVGGGGGGGTRQTVAQNGTSPALAADGKRLAYVTADRNGQALVVADVDGKNARTLVPQGAMEGLATPRFAPDGKQLVFSAVAPMAPVPTTTPPPGRGPVPRADWMPRPVRAHGLPMDLFVVDVEGGTPRRLTELGEDNPAAIWSPDGKRIAILAGGGIYVMNADGSDLAGIDQRGGHGTIDWKRA